MITLTQRLKKAAELIGETKVLADVGCDHGYLPIYLLKKGKIEFAYACDIREGPLMTAKKNIAHYGLSDKTELIKSDGLKELKDKKADVISICGMGGRMAAKILSESEDYTKSADAVVVQPMTEIYIFRKFLCENGYIIEKEVLAKENSRFYNIMRAKRGEEEKKDLFSLYFGKISEDEPLRREYFENHLRIMSGILEAKRGKEDVNELEFLTKKLKETINSIKIKENR